MGNSTNLSSDITAVKSSVVNASNAILSNTANLSNAAKDFVTIAEKMEQRFKELEEKEVEIAKKHKELDEKSKAIAEKAVKMDEREAALNQREQKVAGQEKLFGEIRKVMEASATHTSSEKEATTGTITTTTRTSPRTRTASFSEGVTSTSHHLKRPEIVSPDQSPHLSIKISEPPYTVKRESVTPEPHPPHPALHLHGKREIQTPEPTIPSSLLIPATESFDVWLPTRTFSLIYKATRDGFGRGDFHKMCDNKGPTVTLILSDKGNLFGGYAPISWGRTFEGYDTHPDCFLFTLSNPHNLPPTQYKLRTGNAYGLRNGQHVSFGWCGDIRIADENAHLTTESTSNFARSFVDTTGKGNATFTGEHKFRVLEIEVYLVM